MANKKRNYSYNKGNGKGVKAVVAIIVAALLAAGTFVVGFGWGTNWTFKGDAQNVEQSNPDDSSGNEQAVPTPTLPSKLLAIEEDESEGIGLLARTMLASEAEAYSVPANVENVKVITARILPEDATFQAVDYHIMWVEEDVEENIEDYITLTQEEDGSLTCAVTVIQAFEHQARIICLARAPQDVQDVPYATCTVDYYKRPIFETVHATVRDENKNIPYSFSSSKPLTYENFSEDGSGGSLHVGMNYHKGTITPEIEYSFELRFAESTASKLNAVLSRIGKRTASVEYTSENLLGLKNLILGMLNISEAELQSSGILNEIYNIFAEEYDEYVFCIELVITATSEAPGCSFERTNAGRFNPIGMAKLVTGIELPPSLIF